jgi:protein-L-isoaspartate(D-aspartate) O-methyltransferase
MDAAARLEALVNALVRSGDIQTAAVEAAFRAVPRHLFLPGVALEAAYADRAVPIKIVGGTTVSSASQPAMVALMLEQLAPRLGDNILEVGTGAGYNAALLATIAGPRGRVTTLDVDEDLVADARRNLAAAGFESVRVECADGAAGWPPAAPYDRIVVTAAAAEVAPAWRDQLRDGGRLVTPVDLNAAQCSIAFERRGDVLVARSAVGCFFVPMRSRA